MSTLSNWAERMHFGFKKKDKQPVGWVGLSCFAEGVSLCHCYERDGEKRIDHYEYARVPKNQQVEFVKDWLEDRKLQKAICHYVLNKRDYELLLVESPTVEPSEIAEAVRWRLKDLIKIPLDDAAVDVFELPEDAYRGRVKMIYAAVASKTLIRDRIRFILDCGLKPSVIDIPEMVLRNISLYLPEINTGSVALLSLRRSSGDMLMYSNQALYLTRQIEFGVKDIAPDESAFQLDKEQMIARLSLDIQRSLDYYESQLGKGTASKIYFLPLADDSVSLRDEVQKMVQVTIENYNLMDHLPIDTPKALDNLEQTYCITSMGAALRGNA